MKSSETPFLLEWNAPAPWGSAVKSIAEGLLGLDRLQRIYERTKDHPTPAAFLDAALEELKLEVRLNPGEVERIPAEGPVVVVANHPRGGAEGLAIARLILARRGDLRILANRLLSRIPPLAPLFVPVDPWENEDARNLHAYRAAKEHLRRKGCLLVFPAGEVSSWNWELGRVADPRWKNTAARLARHHGAQVVPIHVDGDNGALFHLAGLVHPTLRTALLPGELLRAGRKPMALRIGKTVSPEKLSALASESVATAYLRARVESLVKRKVWSPIEFGFRAPVARSGAESALAHEVAGLPGHCRLLSQGAFTVFVARSRHVPLALREIGRLREITFREAGEGSGKSIDLDRFDRWYRHLFVWNEEKNEIAGAYRIGSTAEILPTLGVRGLYSSTLFRYHRRFFQELPPAFELGRSFVRKEYQKEFAPLLLLWKGIAALMAREGEPRVLFGPVSMDKTYSEEARDLVTAYLMKNRREERFARWVKARNPVEPRRRGSFQPREMAALLGDLDDLGEVLASRERDGRGLPVLFKQYLKIGGRVAAFHRDPRFADVIDALILVDFATADAKSLERYLGKDGWKAWNQAQRKEEAR